MLELIKRLVAPGRPRNPGTPASVAPAAAVPGTTRPHVVWAEACDPPVVGRRCPNCGGTAPKPPLLTVRYATPGQPLRFVRLLHCPDCTCHFYQRQDPPDYADEEMVGRGRVPYYVQQGAGISLITTPLVRLGKPPGSRYLEVGCGFGFGLDFARRVMGWQAQGIDPAGIAAIGRETLGVAIEQRYLRDDEPGLNGVFDVAMASETIEHVPSPIGFVRALRNVLRPNGVLVLTTPDAADLRGETAPGALVALLSPGWHLIFQNHASLQALLRQAGFSDVVIEKDGFSLVAYASNRPFSLASDKASLHAAYVGYLARRAADFPPGHDLRLGFAGRALFEAANDGDAAAAERSYRMLHEACRTRYGIDLDSIAELPAETATCTLERLAGLMPLSLGCLLYADVMRRLALGEARPPLERRLLCAADAADALRRALAELGQEDALSEEVGWISRAEAVLCAAAAASPDLVARMRALPTFPDRDERRRQAIGERVLVSLVNAGHHALAAGFADGIGMQQAPWANPAYDADPSSVSDVRRDALFCLAILDLRETEPDACGRAVRRFAVARRQIVRSGKPDASRALFWATVQGEMQALERLGFSDQVAGLLAAAHAEAGTAPDEVAATAARIATAARAPDHLVALVNAGQYDEARVLAGVLRDDVYSDPLTGADRDRWFSLAVLEVQPGGDPARAVLRFAAVRKGLAATAPVAPLYWAALRGEIEARSLIDGAGAGDALRRRALQELGLGANEVPEDLRGPRPGGNKSHA